MQSLIFALLGASFILAGALWLAGWFFKRDLLVNLMDRRAIGVRWWPRRLDWVVVPGMATLFVAVGFLFVAASVGAA
jgi:hypothetical protein